MKILTKKDVEALRKLIDYLIMELNAQADASELEVNRNRERIKEKNPDFYMLFLEGDHEFNVKSTRKKAEHLKMLSDLF